MLRSRARSAAVVVLACLGADRSALAQTPVRLGAEFQVNTVTANNQLGTADSLDVETNGDFVLVWSSSLQDGSSNGVFCQRFASSGARLGVEFAVSTYTLNSQQHPAVGSDGDGDFVVAWQSDDGQDGSAIGVFARRFDSSGFPLATEFQVNTRTTGDQSRPVVARDADGDFVIAWQSSGQDGSLDGVFARRFNAVGTPQASELQVNTHTALGQINPAIDVDQGGDFVVTWQSLVQDGNGYGVFAQRFNSLGGRQGIEIQVNDYTTDSQAEPAVGVDADGDFVIAWQSFGQDGSGDGVVARRFASSGLPMGVETHVNVHITGAQNMPSIGIDADGDFVVGWQSSGQDGSGYGVFARRFKASGVPTSGDLQVNTTAAGAQGVPALRSDLDGDFVAAWRSATQDGDDDGVFAQRFDVPALLDIDGNGQLAPLTDGLLLLRFLFGFTGATLTSGAVGPGCTRCNASALEPHLQNLADSGLAPSRLGQEFQVNTTTVGPQSTTLRSRTIDLETNGDFVVVWTSGHDGSQTGVFGQRYDSSGAKLGVEFQINLYTVDAQREPAIALDADGDIVVVWMSPQDGDDAGIFARRFNSIGTAQGGEFQVNVHTLGNQSLPTLARDADGDFVVAWEGGPEVSARRFDSAGVAQGTELQVNTYTMDIQGQPRLDLDENGDFVVTWVSQYQDGNDWGVFGQRFNSLGVRQGPEFQINVFFTGIQLSQAIGLDADGDFVVTWNSQGNVVARRFDSTGAPQGNEMPVNVSNGGESSISLDRNGDFIVTWQSLDGSESGVFARHFTSSGVATTAEIQVNTTVLENQYSAGVRSAPDGDFVIAWSSYGQDGSHRGVFAQRFDVVALLDIDGDGQLTALTDGLLALRFLFGFTGTSLTTGAVGAGCTRCDSATILPYLQSLT